MAGRKPKPTAVKKLEGNQGKRKLNTKEPIPAKGILSEFSCEKNPDVERFLKKSSIEFTKKNQSITYIVLAIDDSELLGYFTIALKFNIRQVCSPGP